MKLSIKTTPFIILFLLSILNIKAQDKLNSPVLTYRETPLRTVLEDIEANFEIKFSYISEIVNDQVVSGRFSTSNLKDLVQRIFEKTNITHQFIDNKNVILNAKNQPKIQKKDKGTV